MRRIVTGKYYEEFEVGDVVTHAVTRTVTEADNVMFTCLTMNPQPMHLDLEFAREYEFSLPLMNSLFTLGLVVGIAVPELTHGTTIANLGFEEITFPAPVFARDTIWVETETIAKRLSKSRSDSGIVTLEHRGYNQNDQLVCKARRAALMRLAPSAANS